MVFGKFTLSPTGRESNQRSSAWKVDTLLSELTRLAFLPLVFPKENYQWNILFTLTAFLYGHFFYFPNPLILKKGK